MAQDVYQEWFSIRGIQELFLKSVVKTDEIRNVYQAGATVSENGDYDVILSKTSPEGNQIWTRVYDVAGYDDAALDIYLDGTDFIYLVGTSFNPNNNGYQVLVMKYSSAGTLVWHNLYNYPNSLYNVASSLTVDSNRVYIGGASYNPQTQADFLTLSYSVDGNLLWQNVWDNVNRQDGITSIFKRGTKLIAAGGTEVDVDKWRYCIQAIDPSDGSIENQIVSGGNAIGIDRVSDLYRDDDGNIYVTGGVTNSSTGYDFLTLKLDSTLNILWSATYNSANSLNDIANGLAVDSSGNVFFCGQSETSTNGTDYRTIKYSPSGNQLWLKSFNGMGNKADSAKAIIVDEDQNVIVTGVTHNGSNSDIHTVKYNTNGSEIWNIDFNGLQNGDDRAFDIALDDFGDIIVAGQIESDGVYSYVAVKYIEADVTNPFGATEPENKSGLFTINRGQIAGMNGDPVSSIKFTSSDGNANLYLSDTSMSYSLYKGSANISTPDTVCTFNLQFYNSVNHVLYGRDISKSYFNYYLSQTPEGLERVHGYKTVVYPDLWREIDVFLTHGTSDVNYYFVAKPGSNVSNIKFYQSNTTNMTIDSSTDELVVETLCGQHRFPKPRVYQIDAAGQTINLTWEPQYAISGNEVSFTLGSFNTNLPLVIALDKINSPYDIIGLCWSSYFGGESDIRGSNIQYNSIGEIIGAGYKTTGECEFSQYGTATFNSNKYQGFVYRLEENYHVNWMTFYGGSSDSYLADMVQNEKEDIYCVGSTRASDLQIINPNGGTNYPYAGSGPIGSNAYDAYVFKLDGTDGGLLWSTYLGQSGAVGENDFGNNIALSSDNRLYVSGVAGGGTFQHPGNSNTFNGGNSDFFLCAFDENDIHQMTYFLGGSDEEIANGLAVDIKGNVWIHGSTNSDDFPTHFPGNPGLLGFYDTQLSGYADDFIAMFSPAYHNSIRYASYFGGDDKESYFICNRYQVRRRDYLTFGENKIYFIGLTNSTGNSFPIHQDQGNFNFNQNDLGTLSPFSSTANGYIASLDITNYSQNWCTFINDADNGDGSDAKNYPIAIHSQGFASSKKTPVPFTLAICGQANSQNEMLNPGNLSYTSSGYPSTGSDGFVYIFEAGLTANNLIKSTFFGGQKREFLNDVVYQYDSKLAIGGGIYGNADGVGYNLNFPLDDPGNGAIFSNYLSDGTIDQAFFAEFCDDEITGLENLELHESKNMLAAFPNPATDQLTVKGEFSRGEPYTLFDVYGNSVLSGLTGDGEFRIDCSDLASGSYILKIGKNFTRKNTIKIIIL